MPFSSRSTVCPWSVHCSFGPNGQEDPHASRIQTCDQISINPVCEVAIKHNVLNLFYRNYVPCTVDSWLSDPVLPSKGDRVAVCLNGTLLSLGSKSKLNLRQLSLGHIGKRLYNLFQSVCSVSQPHERDTPLQAAFLGCMLGGLLLLRASVLLKGRSKKTFKDPSCTSKTIIDGGLCPSPSRH